MSVNENIERTRRWFQEVWNEGRFETVHDLFSPDAVARGQRGGESEIRGPEEFVKFVREIRGASASPALSMEKSLRAGTTGINSECSSKSVCTSSPPSQHRYAA